MKCPDAWGGRDVERCSHDFQWLILLLINPQTWLIGGHISQTSNTLGATNSFWLPGLTFCGSHCWHDDGNVLWQSQSPWVHVICTRMWRHTQHAKVSLKGRFLLKPEVFLLQGFCLLLGELVKSLLLENEQNHEREVWRWWSLWGCSKMITEAGSHCTKNRGFLNKASVLQWCKESPETVRKVMSSSSWSPPPQRKQHFLCLHQLLCKY